MECASMRLTSRCGGGLSTRPHHRATFCKRRPMMRSNRPSAAAMALQAHANFLARSWNVRPCDLLVATPADG
eukprot:5420847-Lingulodinium_polyedra.AAC.1